MVFRTLYGHGIGHYPPWQAVSAHGVAGSRAVARLEAVDERAVQAGLALLQTAVLFEAAGPAGHALGILSVTKATFLQGLAQHTRPLSHRDTEGGVGGVREREWERERERQRVHGERGGEMESERETS